MAKQGKIKSDPFLLFLASAVVIILAVFIINTTTDKGDGWRVEGTSTSEPDSPASLMRELDETADDGGLDDFRQLERMNRGL